MEFIKNNVKSSFQYLVILLKWLLLATIVGLLGGLVGSLFHLSVDFVTEVRMEHPWVLYLLPLGGVLIVGMYYLFRAQGQIDTNRVLESVSQDKNIPFVMVPLIFISTVITHFLGGSAGREGAALQLGGGIGYNVGKCFRLNQTDKHIIVMAGMSSVFSALFGTPLTATVFAIEVVCVGILHYESFLPCIISSVVAYHVSLFFGISPVRFDSVVFQAITLDSLIKVIVLSILCALVSILFCTAIHKCEHSFRKLFHNKYIEAFIGAALVILLTLLVGSFDYNGAGMDIITRAIGGEARPEAFLLKIIFTAITISAGFKGGEIVPAFFVGSTFGCTAGALLGLDASFGAAIGFVALFCGVVNCPLASVFLSIEVFGAEGILFFATACAVSYLMSGHFGLYKSQ
ncbi:MAG: chloride channel protein, partial [Clostridia bacterium]|nr:chloride channel protein [Clostridia bacterium]